VAMIAPAQAVKYHLCHRLLADLSFAARLVIQSLRQTTVLVGQLGLRGIVPFRRSIGGRDFRPHNCHRLWTVADRRTKGCAGGRQENAKGDEQHAVGSRCWIIAVHVCPTCEQTASGRKQVQKACRPVWRPKKFNFLLEKQCVVPRGRNSMPRRPVPLCPNSAALLRYG